MDCPKEQNTTQKKLDTLDSTAQKNETTTRKPLNATQKQLAAPKLRVFIYFPAKYIL